jgi:hypothetical protein
MIRDTWEGWPLLTVETEVDGDLKSAYERGSSLVGSLGLLCRYKRFLFCLGCSSRPYTKYFFPHRTLFQYLCPQCPASWADSCAGTDACLLVCVSVLDFKKYTTYTLVHIFMKQGKCVCPLSWSVHCNFTGDGNCNERGWACTPHPHQPGLILPSWWNVRQNAAVAILCTLWEILCNKLSLTGGKRGGVDLRLYPWLLLCIYIYIAFSHLCCDTQV